MTIANLADDIAVLLAHFNADDLAHLAAIRRQQEDREAWEQAGRLADLLWRPALGHHRKQAAK